MLSLSYREYYAKALQGILGFGYLAISQLIIQTKILVDVTSEWKSSLLFPAIAETRATYNFQYDQESITFLLILSVAGTMHYLVSDKYSWILIVPWIVNSAIHWISSSYTCLKNVLLSFDTDDFWVTLGLMILLISVKCLLLSEVVMKVWESVFKIITCSKELNSMLKRTDEDDSAEQESDGSVGENSLQRISDDF